MPCMASVARDETMIVRKVPPPPPRTRRLTTRFGPDPRVRWPWLVAALVWLAGLIQPIDPDRELRLSTTAHELRRALPG